MFVHSFSSAYSTDKFLLDFFIFLYVFYFKTLFFICKLSCRSWSHNQITNLNRVLHKQGWNKYILPLLLYTRYVGHTFCRLAITRKPRFQYISRLFHFFQPRLNASHSFSCKMNFDWSISCGAEGGCKKQEIDLLWHSLGSGNCNSDQSCVEFIPDSGGSRPGHKVSATRSKLPNLNENGQKPHFFARFFWLRTRSKFCLDPPLPEVCILELSYSKSFEHSVLPFCYSLATWRDNFNSKLGPEEVCQSGTQSLQCPWVWELWRIWGHNLWALKPYIWAWITG